MATQTTFSAAGFANFVSNVAIKFLKEIELSPPDMVRAMYTMVPWRRESGELVTFDAYALPKYAQRIDENEGYPLLNVQEGDSLSKYQIQYGAKMDYTVRMEQFDKLELASSFVSKMIDAIYSTIDLELTHQIFTYADSATYTPKNKPAVNISCGDGLALASAAHTVQGTGSTTYSNLLSGGGALSISNLTTLIQQMQQNTVNEKGDLCPFRPDTLVIAGDAFMKKKAREILGSPLGPENNNNAVNVYATPNDFGMKLVVLNRGFENGVGTYDSTKRYRWGLMDSRYKESFQYMVSSDPKLRLSQGSSDNALFSILVDAFVAYGCPRWQGIGYSLSTTQP